MGKRHDLTDAEKSTIVGRLACGSSTLSISKFLGRDHRTIKTFTADATKKRKRQEKRKFRAVDRREVTLLKKASAKFPFATSLNLFNEAQVNCPSRATRCRVLSSFANVRTAKKIPPLSEANVKKRLEWAKKYMKIDFKNVIFSDECRASLDGPDGFGRGWLQNGKALPTRLRRQQGGGGVMFWAAIHDNILIGPFRVPDGVKMNAAGYVQFLRDNFLPYYNHLNANRRTKTIFMHDNASSHASAYTKQFLEENGITGNKLMEWPPQSPDLNPIENYWSVFKSLLYKNGRQFNNKDDLWNGILSSFNEIDRSLSSTLVKSVDNRIAQLFHKNGKHIKH